MRKVLLIAQAGLPGRGANQGVLDWALVGAAIIWRQLFWNAFVKRTAEPAAEAHLRRGSNRHSCAQRN